MSSAQEHNEDYLIKVASEAAVKSATQALKEYHRKSASPATILGIITGALFCCAGFTLAILGLPGPFRKTKTVQNKTLQRRCI